MNKRRIIPLVMRPSAAGLAALGQEATASPFLLPPPLTLYVHYPWCVRKCPYCDFNSHSNAVADAAQEAAYVSALLADLEEALPQLWGRRVYSVFFGGGTPSLLQAEALDRLLSGFRALLPLDPEAEITLEANPGSVEVARFRDFRAAGINRLSIGIQSFNDDHLGRLGRIHDSFQARQAIDVACQCFERVNLDLMYALPGQTRKQARLDIETALRSGASHLSCYQLTLEPNTLFQRHPPPLPDEDAAADMQEWLEQRLGEAGFRHYETSAFAQPGQQCQHNLNYWRFGDYLGIGAGAHSKLSMASAIVREMRHKHPRQYLAAAVRRQFVHTREPIGEELLACEFMMNALRLCDGFEAGLFQARTGLALVQLVPALARASAAGLLISEGGRIAPTRRGQRFLNDLLCLFMDAAAST